MLSYTICLNIKFMENKKFLSTTELAKILSISRIAVYNRIKKGEIKAVRVGRNFVIDKKELGKILETELTEKQRIEIKKAVEKIVKEYRETLKLLGTT